MGKVKLFCFPYAGASATVYKSWKPYLGAEIELYPVEMAGRGKRIKEPLPETLEQAVNQSYTLILPEIGQGRFIFFGHSMGALIAYELAHKLQTGGQPVPGRLFCAGLRAPDLHWQEEAIHHLSDDDFAQKVLELGGATPELFSDPELRKVYLPILRRDFRITNTYDFIRRDPLECDITVFYGEREFIPPTNIKAWREHTRKNCNIYPFNGDHFFIHTYRAEIIAIIKQSVIPGMG